MDGKAEPFGLTQVILTDAWEIVKLEFCEVDHIDKPTGEVG